MQEFDKAIDDYNASLKNNPRGTNVIINRSLAYDETDQKEKAWEDVKKALELGADLDRAYVERIKAEVLESKEADELE